MLILLVFCIQLNAQQQAYRIRKLANYNNPNLPKVDITDIWNDCTGYFDPIKNREYAIAGGTDSIYFFDITNPSEMKLVDVRYGKSFYARNRDYECYKHYVYCVSDQSQGIGGLQIFDLSYLPDSVHKVFEGGSFPTSSHTIFIDSISKRMYLSGNTNPASAMCFATLENPEIPVLLANLNVPKKPNGYDLFNYVHEMYARHDTAYLSCAGAGLYIFDLRNPANQTMIGSITSYPDQDYNHSSWLDKTGKYLMFTDENMGMDVKIFDIKNLSEPKFVSQFNSNAQATPHNAFWVGNFCYMSAYHDGVRVFDIGDPGNPVPVAWYDTHPDSPEVYGGFKGCWGIYPFLPSHRIIASDLTSGIFVLEIDSDLVGVNEKPMLTDNFSIYPNPSHDFVTIENKSGSTAQLQVMDLEGKILLQQDLESPQNKINLQEMATGTYFIRIQTHGAVLYKKLLRW